MITIEFALSHSFIRLVKRTLVTSQSKNYVQAHFDVRSDDWTAPITAIFSARNNAYSVLLDENNTCIIPWEVLTSAGTVNVSAFCGDRHTANIAQFTVVQSGYTEGEMPSEPTPTVYEQILKNFEGKQDKLIAGDGIKINGNVISAADAKSAYVIALEHGFIGSEDEWLASLKGEQGIQGAQGIQGEKGDQGIQGEKGKDGADGKTSVKGTDYFTAEDKTEFTAEVAKSLEGKITNKANLELMAQNRGSGWHLETIKATSANQLLMMIELGIMSTQTGVGQGVVNIRENASYNCSSLTGSTTDLGNGTGQAAESVNEIGGTETTYNVNGKVSVSYRGIENPWGNIGKHIQGLNIWGDGTMSGGQLYIANDFTFNESKHSDNYEPVGFTLPNGNGYIKAMGYGSEEYDWLLVPSEIGGTTALPVGDSYYATSNLKGYRIARLGGSWGSGTAAGGFYWDCTYGIGTKSRNTGGRLLYVPTAKV